MPPYYQQNPHCVRLRFVILFPGIYFLDTEVQGVTQNTLFSVCADKKREDRSVRGPRSVTP